MHEMLDVVVNHILNPATMLGTLFFGVLYLAIAIIGAFIVRVWSRRLKNHPALIVDETSAHFISQLLQLGCFLVAITAYAHTIPALHRFGMALLASASMISIILGFAAQSTLGNLIAGVALLFYRPFGIGDVLAIGTPTGKEIGTVKEFSLGYTKLVTEDGRWIIAPNSVVISSILVRIK